MNPPRDEFTDLRELALDLGRKARQVDADEARERRLGPAIPDPLAPDHTITGYVVDRLFRASRRAIATLADAYPDVTADAYRAGYDPHRFTHPRGARR